MKKIYPFWLIDPVGAEKKFDELSEKGFRLTDMNFFGMCSFSESTPEKRVNRIMLGKGGLPKGAQAKGWESLCEKKLFYVASNPDTTAAMGYDSFLKLHSITKIVLFVMPCFFIGRFLGATLALMDADTLPPKAAVHLMENLVFCLIPVILWIALMVCDKRIPKTDLKLGGALKTIPAENFVYTKAEEKQMIKDGRMISKFRPGWFYEPDKTKEYVKGFNRDGWRFYRFDAAGTTFYFVKENAPVYQSFEVDYQNHSSDEYFLNAKEDGWKLEFTSLSRTTGFTMWTKLYNENEPEPAFYSDSQSEYNRAKRLFITFGILFVFMIIVAVMLVVLAVTEMIGAGATLFMIYFAAMYAVITIEYLVFLIKIAGYFFRSRNKFKNNN